jgi:hypothetical protein
MAHRIIGVRHQQKKTVEGEESHPTQLYILEGDVEPRKIEFGEVSEEFGWLAGKYPISYREITDLQEDISDHKGLIIFGKPKEEELEIERHESQIQMKKGRKYIARKVPTAYDGVRPDDIYVSMVGGSGHQLMAALSARLAALGGPEQVFQTSPKNIVARYSKARDKEKDAEVVLALFRSDPALFHPVLEQDRKISRVKACWARREAAQYARIAHQLRLRKASEMKGYADPERYVGARLEAETLAFISGDKDMDTLEADEGEELSELDQAVTDTEVWKKVFKPVEGVGPAIAGGLIAAIGDIRRFEKSAQLTMYCGVAIITHDKEGNLLPRPTIQRNRTGGLGSAFHRGARKALWNFSTQCVKWKKNSAWGLHYQELLKQTMAIHPVPVEEINRDGKKVMRYTELHCRKIARWKLQTDFVVWIWRQWKRVHRYPGDLYYTEGKNDMRPWGMRRDKLPPSLPPSSIAAA